MNIIGHYLFNFPVSGCSLIAGEMYILVFDGCRWNFLPYASVSGEQQLSIDCETGELSISGDGGNSVDLSCLCELCAGDPAVIPSNELVINVNDPEVVGKQYQSFANAFAYLASLPPAAAPSMYNRRAIRFSGTHTENITLPPYINLNGDGMLTAMLTGQVHLTAVVEPYSNTLSNCFVNNLYTYFGSGIPVFIPITMGIGHGVEFLPDNVRRAIMVAPSDAYDIVGGTYTVTIDGNTTTPIAYDAAPATVIAAIEALDSSYVGNIVLSSSGLLPDLIEYIVSFVGLPAGVSKTITVDTTGLITNPVGGSILVKTSYTPGLIEQHLVGFSYPPTQGIWALRLLYNGFVYGTPNIVWSGSYTDMVPVVQAAIDTMFADIQAANPTAILGTPLVEEYTYGFKVTFNGFGGDTNMMTYWIDEKHNPLGYLGNAYSGIRVMLDHVVLAGCTGAQLSEGETSYLDMINDCKIFGGDYVGCEIIGNGLYVNAVISDIHIYDSGISQGDIIGKNSYFYNTGFTSTNIFKELNITGDCSLHNCYIDGDVTIVDKLEASQSTFLKNVLVDTTGAFYDMSNVIGGTFTNLGIHSNLGERYDNTISGLSSTNRKAAIDELAGLIGAGGRSLLGNAGLVDGVNFVGTTDNVPFNIKVNNTQSGRIDTELFNTFYGYSSGFLYNGIGGSVVDITLPTGGGTGYDVNPPTVVVDPPTGLGTQAVYTAIVSVGGEITGFTQIDAGSGYMSVPVVTITGGNNDATGMAVLDVSTGYHNVGIGTGALRNNILGRDNVGVGYLALSDNTNGYDNTAIGRIAMTANLVGVGNTVVGSGSLGTAKHSSYNTLVGVEALGNMECGDYNTVLGYGCLVQNDGEHNTIIGANAGYLNYNGSSNIFIGYNAGHQETGSFKFIIDSVFRSTEAETRLNALLYGEIGATAASQKLVVNGKFGVVDSNIAYYTYFKGGNQAADVEYTLPVDDGDAGQSLHTDGSGVLSWSYPVTKTGSGTPVGSVTPDYIGQHYIDTAGPTVYHATGTTNADWVS